VIGAVVFWALVGGAAFVLWFLVSLGVDLIDTPRRRAVRRVQSDTWHAQRRVEQITRDAHAEILRLVAEGRRRR
jgi:hypothetical protein